MSIVHIARRAGVSTATVSRVLNDIPGVRLETQKQVRAAVGELSGLIADVRSPQMRQHARSTLAALEKISSDGTLRAACDNASRQLLNDRPLAPDSVPGIVTAPITHDFK